MRDEGFGHFGLRKRVAKRVFEVLMKLRGSQGKKPQSLEAKSDVFRARDE
jgi:hypothetical protein